MSKKDFSAVNWFAQNKINVKDSANNIIRSRQNSPQKTHGLLAPFIDQKQNEIMLENELNKFFVPGWKGESLISKDIKSFIHIIDQIHQDVRQHFHQPEKFSRTMKRSIFEEFLNFAEFKSLNCNGLDTQINFWKQINNPETEYRAEIDHFLNIFSFRIAVIYLLKVRFITTLFNKTNKIFDIKNIYYPNSFFTSVFQSASSTELKTKSFKQNVFSWYKPNKSLEKDLKLYSEVCNNLKITEIIKTISVKSEEILQQQTEYSHSISHKQFGLFLNSLLINFPIWLNTLNNKSTCAFTIPNGPLEIISCKYAGDYLESMGLSHWLAQDHNKNLKWEQILCPDFKSYEFESGLFLNQVNELQFLTFLAEIANIQGHEPISFVCKVINSHLHNRKNSNEIQKSLIFNDSALNDSTYDRIILNLNVFPKNNPQHYLFTQIQSQKKFLKDEGFIFVLTPKKIFVPSQKSKIDQLLNEFKIEGVINLEDVKGKGEVPCFLYIFSKRKAFLPNDGEQKHLCLNFRLSGNLKTFHENEKITELINTFFQKHLGDLPPMYQQSSAEMRIEFYQDAIVGGQLIHSSTKDASNITHPGFFKKLMSLCHPLSYFFDIQNISFDSHSNQESNTFFDYTNSFNREASPHIFIVDQREKNNVRIEIINSSLLEVKSYEYGHALCNYFYAYQKWPQLDIHSIQDYLNSSIGKQIINLTFNNELRKVKGNLNKLLLPNFYIEQKIIPSSVHEGLSLLNSSSEQILNTHPTTLENSFLSTEYLVNQVSQEFPCEVLKRMSQFKKTLKKSIDILGSDKNTNSLNFNNPIMKSPLVMSKTYALYPDNEDVYVSFNSDAHALIHSPLDQCKVVKQEVNNQINHGLELIVQGQCVLTLYSDERMVAFLNYLFAQTVGHPISGLLQGVSIPKLENLISIIDSYKSLSQSLHKVYDKITPTQDRLISSAILNNK